MQDTTLPENLGFLTVIDQSRFGLIGGYLVLNPAGRPLEFHCTSPIKPNKAQEILYGETLEPYLCGEQIARTLLSRSKTPIRYVLTNTASVLPVQAMVDKPIIYVFGKLERREMPAQSTGVDEEARQGPVSLEESGENVTEEDPREIPLEISEELNHSLKLFGIENSRLQTASQDDPARSLRIPRVAGLNTDLWSEAKIGNRRIAVPDNEESRRQALLEEIKLLSRNIDLLEPFTRIRLAVEEAQRAA